MKTYFINAFTNKPFGGNPAAVISLKEWLPTELMQRIAKENRVAETAFIIPVGEGYGIRWFTPEIEMDLCGHATLASAYVLKNYLNAKEDVLQFESASGMLKVDISDDKFLVLDFPSRMPIEAELPDPIRESLNIQPNKVLKSRDYILVYESEAQIRSLNPDQKILDQINLDPGGVAVTAPGDSVDFVSRFFSPQASIFEDPVTGSAHCSLIPYWSEKLGILHMTALQLSDRLGKLICTNANDRVFIAGECTAYMIADLCI